VLEANSNPFGAREQSAKNLCFLFGRPNLTQAVNQAYFRLVSRSSKPGLK
jgi:hypothetical protein